MKRFYRIVLALLLLYMMTACESKKQQHEFSSQSEPSETVTEVITELPTEITAPATEPENEISQIDFDFFEDKMDSDTWNVFQAYTPVLQGEAEFVISMKSSDHISPPYEKIQDRTNLNDFFFQNGETGDSIMLDQFSVFDLDSDGIQELIVCFENLSGQYLVFHAENGEFYAATFVHRGFQYLSPTGIYFASGGAGCLHWRTLTFEDGKFIESELASSDRNTEKLCQEYIIDGELVDESTYAVWEQTHFPQFSVPWYQPLENGKWCRKIYDYSEWGTDQEELL